MREIVRRVERHLKGAPLGIEAADHVGRRREESRQRPRYLDHAGARQHHEVAALLHGFGTQLPIGRNSGAGQRVADHIGVRFGQREAALELQLRQAGGAADHCREPAAERQAGMGDHDFGQGAVEEGADALRAVQCGRVAVEVEAEQCKLGVEAAFGVFVAFPEILAFADQVAGAGFL